MANEISISINGKLTNGNLTRSFTPGSKTYDQATQAEAAGTVALTSDSTTIPLDAVSGKVGFVWLTNVSTSIDILLGPTTSSYFIKLPPESSHSIHLTSDTTVCAQTTASTAVLHYDFLAV